MLDAPGQAARPGSCGGKTRRRRRGCGGRTNEHGLSAAGTDSAPNERRTGLIEGASITQTSPPAPVVKHLGFELLGFCGGHDHARKLGAAEGAVTMRQNRPRRHLRHRRERRYIADRTHQTLRDTGLVGNISTAPNAFTNDFMAVISAALAMATEGRNPFEPRQQRQRATFAKPNTSRHCRGRCAVRRRLARRRHGGRHGA